MARHRKARVCARVQEAFGENVIDDVPVVIPFSTAQSTGLKNQSDSLTSLNGLSVEPGSGLPAARHRNVTIWARVHGVSGENVFSVVPLVILFSSAQYTGA